MNVNQKKCLMLGIIVIVIMGVFPPWRMYSCFPKSNMKRYEPMGYSFIAEPPKPSWQAITKGVAIDLPRLLIQWAIVAAITGGLIVCFKGEKDKEPKNEQKQ